MTLKEQLSPLSYFIFRFEELCFQPYLFIKKKKKDDMDDDDFNDDSSEDWNKDEWGNQDLDLDDFEPPKISKKAGKKMDFDDDIDFDDVDFDDVDFDVRVI